MGPGGTEPQRIRPWNEVPPPESFVRRRRPVPTADQLRTLLREHDGNVSEVARKLDRQWAVVWRTMRRYGISADEFRVPEPGGGGARRAISEEDAARAAEAAVDPEGLDEDDDPQLAPDEGEASPTDAGADPDRDPPPDGRS